jgi:hypothetical protein
MRLRAILLGERLIAECLPSGSAGERSRAFLCAMAVLCRLCSSLPGCELTTRMSETPVRSPACVPPEWSDAISFRPGRSRAGQLGGGSGGAALARGLEERAKLACREGTGEEEALRQAAARGKEVVGLLLPLHPFRERM